MSLQQTAHNQEKFHHPTYENSLLKWFFFFFFLETKNVFCQLKDDFTRYRLILSSRELVQICSILQLQEDCHLLKEIQALPRIH